MTNTLTAEQIAQGWKLVPIEPTLDMMEAWQDGMYRNFEKGSFRDAYAAMLAAASLPSPPVSGERLLSTIGAAIADRTKDRDASTGSARTQLNGVLIGLKEAWDLFAENAKNSPLTNEPGVATREEWEAAQDAGLINFVTMIDEGDLDEFDRAALAALTEALTRIEELEGALRPIMNAASGWVHDKGNDALRLYIAPDYSDGIYPRIFTLGDLRRAATLTKGTKE